MAKALNKHRIRDTWIIACISAGLVLTTRMQFAPHEAWHEVLELVGYVFIVICALGRIYCTAFLGGFKNKKVIDYGPFSVVRNPLYLFSFLGIIGISLMSLHLSVMFFAPLAIGFIYYFLIRREEGFLDETLGDDYRSYYLHTPRLIPDFSQYHQPETMTIRPRMIRRAVLDAACWFVAFPIFELIDLIQH